MEDHDMAADLQTAIDPVCGMTVDARTSPFSLEHDGRTYYFCSRGCMLDFRDQPEQFLDPRHKPSMPDEPSSLE